jgi:hypothetical protein
MRTFSASIGLKTEDENGQASFGLANNLPANNAGNRFHDAFYGAGSEFGQEGKDPSGGSSLGARDVLTTGGNVRRKYSACSEASAILAAQIAVNQRTLL